MTKRISILILCALLSTMFGCQSNRHAYPTDNSYHPETDCAFYLASFYDGTRLAETENGFYFSVNNTLLYFDYDTMDYTPLCSKPNCMHNNETDPEKQAQCEAYFPAISWYSRVFLYNQSLYVFHKTGIGSQYSALTKVSLDGTERKTLFTFECFIPTYAIVHRGRFYCVVETVSENAERFGELLSYSLDSPRQEPISHFKYKGRPNYEMVITELFAYGNNVYFREMREDNTVVEHVLDIKTGELTTLNIPDDFETTRYNLIADASLLSFYGKLGITTATYSGNPVGLYKRVAANSSAEYLGDYPYSTVCADLDYLYLSDPYTGDTRNDSFRIYDHNLTLVDSIPFAQLPSHSAELLMCMLYPSSNDTLFFEAFYADGLYVYYYFSREDIGSGDIELTEFFRYRNGEY